MKSLSLLGFLLFIFNFASQAAAETKTPKIDPPALVECKTDATCDRDPKHLEAFVSGFYQWYVATGDEFFTLPSVATEAGKKKVIEFGNQERRIENESITKEFLTWHDNQLSKPPGDRENKPGQCSGDVDFLLCGQDWRHEWILNASAQLIAVDQHNAVLIVTLPIPPNKKSGQQFIPHLLSVRLKPEDGVWKISNVMDLIVDY